MVKTDKLYSELASVIHSSVSTVACFPVSILGPDTGEKYLYREVQE